MALQIFHKKTLFSDLVLEQDINASNDEKNTPLHYACLNGHTEVITAVHIHMNL